MKKLIAAALAFLMLALTFAGCSNSDESIDMIYPFGGNINSFDPQVASTEDEFLITENCFEGLVRCDDEGNITPGSVLVVDCDPSGLRVDVEKQ